MTRFPDALDTASVYLTLAGLGCRIRGKARLGGVFLLLSGFGYGGLVHERYAGARLSGYRHGNRAELDLGQLLLHAALVVAGIDWLSR